ncbi:sulfatase-like hydrolase/transferase [Pseudalgibacter alginicilyticus]|uniref:sulfatase-like hydrolase/transferase n=1 Tax=Pseudalgibacter alginicilyticus TaxID=1736674 RepID=UPI0009EA1A53|nr:sulfatase-like hydrolase/transferase [Pseudalgibacter alginicilyticus]
MKIKLKIIIVIAVTQLVSCNQTKKDNVIEENNLTEKLPNIVLINADDLGYGDLSCYGATLVNTPNIDQLAVEGRMFTDAHSPSAVCSASRYGLITGQYPLRRNYWGAIGGLDQGLTVDTTKVTIASVLKESGYATACIGKWHLGLGTDKPDYNADLKPGPLELGFDYFYGIPMVNSGPPYVYVENHGVVGYDPADPFVLGKKSVTQQWPAKGGYTAIGGAEKAHLLYQDEKVGTTLKNKAIEWMKNTYSKNKEHPFFLYLATTNIHHPFTPAPQFKGTSKAGLYGDFIHELDWMVGEVMKTLKDLGVADNTLVIFTSDNGGMLNFGGQDAIKAGHKINGELLGFKFGAWEGGHRVPFIARWPDKIPANSKSDHLISQIDLLPTFSTIVDKKLRKNECPDGINQLPEFLGEATNPLRDLLIISPNVPEHLTVRKGDWVYIPAQDSGGFQGKNIGDHTLGGAASTKLTGQINSDVLNGEIKKDAPSAQLYNLKDDPSQTTNVYGQHLKIQKELHEILISYRAEIGPYPELGWIHKRILERKRKNKKK